MRKVRPKKRFGQHFLADLNIAESIAQSIKGHREVKEVLEIGPGMGVLTDFLLEGGWDLYLVEVDRESVAYLNNKYPALKGRIIEADFLKYDISKEVEGEYVVAGNFPYNISSQIFFK